MDWIKAVLIILALLVFAVPFYLFGLATVLGLAYRIFDERVLDPRRIRLIQAHFKALGYPEVKVQVHDAHFGVRYRLASGKSHYVKCTVRKGEISWIGDEPQSKPQPVSPVVP